MLPAAKLIYLARRNPNLSSEQFLMRWRQHGAFAMRLPMWNHVFKYSQCRPIACATHDYDAVGLVFYRSRAEFEESSGPGKREGLLDDELATFSEHVRHGSMLTEERAVREGPLSKFKLFVFLTDADERTEQMLSSMEADRVVRSDVMRSAAFQEARVPYRSIFELCFDGEPALEGCYRSLLESDLGSQRQECLLVPTIEAQLYCAEQQSKE